MGLYFDQPHQILKDQIAVKFLAFLFCERTVTIISYQLICSFSYFG